MTLNTETQSSHQFLSHYADYVVGIATFDLDGLPKQHFTTSRVGDGAWIQTIFQTLCLHSLLSCSLKLEGCSNVRIAGLQHNILVVKQEARYVGLLLQKETPEDAIQSILSASAEL